MTPLWVSFALLAIGIVAIYVEIFVPAAGLIGLAGGGMIVAGVVLGYVNHGALNGSVVLISSLVVTPLAIVIGLKAFRHAPVGKRLILQTVLSWTAADSEPEGAGSQPSGHTAGDGDASRDGAGPSTVATAPLVGQEGEAITVLRPSGLARIGGKRLSVVSSGEYIEPGERVRVVRVEGSRIVVRHVKTTHPAEA